MPRILLPIGIERFRELREKECYYVDKTRFIEELVNERFKVILFTRPRRFGKTLMMSMLADYFDIRQESAELFEGLQISEHKSLCGQWMNKWPVIFITLKNVDGLSFEIAYDALKKTISDLCVEHSYLLKSVSADEDDKTVFRKLKACEGSETEIREALFLIMRMMRMHYGKSVILLMDEYDVPLANASEHGYYTQMLDVIRNFVGKALKTNEFLNFSVITGCLRIAEESIFTGTNNFISNSISGPDYSDCFGFTEEEVRRLLENGGLETFADSVRQWYDGYWFGRNSIYCPWDVLNYVRTLQIDLSLKPENYWRNTSHNGIIRSFIERTDLAVHDKFERLLAGGYVQEQILEDMTYDTLYSTEANLWSVLYQTGYLTRIRPEEKASLISENGKIFLKIPNEEIKTIFADTIAGWFADEVHKMNRQPLFDAFWNGNDKEAAVLVTDVLFDAISYFDYREDYYHAFLAGLFAGAGYAVESNREYGLGRPDIVIRDRKNRRILIIEVKHSDSEQRMERDCEAAFAQINVRHYAHQFLKGYRDILCYGVAFYEKECRIKKADIRICRGVSV